MVNTSINDNPKEKMVIEIPIAFEIIVGKSKINIPTGGRIVMKTKNRILRFTKSIIYPPNEKVIRRVTTATIPNWIRTNSEEIFIK